MTKYVATVSSNGKLTIFSVDDSYLHFETNINNIISCQLINPKDKIKILYGDFNDLFLTQFGLLILKFETFTKHELIDYLFTSEPLI